MSLCLNPHCLQQKNKETVLFCQNCGSELLLNGRYRVIRELGGGRFGKTYEVIDCILSEANKVNNPIKILKTLNHNHPEHIELFQQEAQFLINFHHPGIPLVEPDDYFTYYPYQTTEPVYCLLMEKIEGLDLKQYIIQRGACISQKRAIKWLIQVAQILKEMHRHHFFHRDIKPSNIMLRANGQLALIDFGTAQEVTETNLLKRSSRPIKEGFTTEYSPLEQLNGQAVPQSDFFALGRTFVYLLTGKSPSDFYDSYVDEIHWQGAVQDILDSKFANFLDYMMAPLPRERPKDVDEIIQTLKKLYHILYTEEKTRFQSRPNNTLNSIHSRRDEKNITDSTNSLDFLAESSFSSTLIDFSVSSPPPPVDEAFVKHCQTILAELVGPVALIICQKTFKKNPKQSEIEFVEAISQKIPNPQQVKQFRAKIFS